MFEDNWDICHTFIVVYFWSLSAFVGLCKPFVVRARCYVFWWEEENYSKIKPTQANHTSTEFHFQARSTLLWGFPFTVKQRTCPNFNQTLVIHIYNLSKCYINFQALRNSSEDDNAARCCIEREWKQACSLPAVFPAVKRTKDVNQAETFNDIIVPQSGV